MQSGFNSEQLHKDLEDIKNFISGFFKSFGPTPKKIGETRLGFIEEQKVRFHLNLVEMGISKIIRISILIIVGLAIVLPILLLTAGILQVIVIFIFLSFGIWLMMDHLVVNKKPVSTVAGYLVKIHDTRIAGQKALGTAISGAVDSLGTKKSS